MDIFVMMEALGAPTRLSIYQRILQRKHCVRSLSRKLGITESAVSQHIKVLREAGLVYGERFGYHIHYLPSQEAIDLLCGAFLDMKRQSDSLVRDPGICQCEYRKEDEE